jgi:glycosyltransferase involved in cell wall biosynthesis
VNEKTVTEAPPLSAHPEPPRRRVLVIAEAANPAWTSVPLVGWSLAAALREVADVHLVTQVRNREAILAEGWVEGQDFTAIDSEALMRPVWKLAERLRMGQGKGWTMLQAIASATYPYFEHLVWRQFGDDIRAKKYDLVHRITPLSPTATSSLARKCKKAGVPFLLGPLNGGVPWPKGFDADRRREREFLSYVRGVYKLMPGRRRMLNDAAAIITASTHTMSEIPKEHRAKTLYIPENAIDPARFNLTAPQDLTPPLRAVFVGRLVPYKGPEMLLEAMEPLLAQGRMALDIIGSGPLEEALKAKNLPNVRFHGWLDHRQVQVVMAQANLLTFPSVREFGGGVVLEAMALGVVPMVCDYAGPAELVTPDTGFALPMGSRAEIITRFRAKLTALCDDPTRLSAMGKAAQRLISENFTWGAKAAQIRQIYDWVLGTDPRPDPFHRNPT